MKQTASLVIALSGVLALGGIFGQSTLAQAPPPGRGYVGRAASTVAGCPYIEWRLAIAANGTDVHGIAIYSDLSGLSQVTGTVNSAGQFQLEFKSFMGNGPVGTVQGTRDRHGRLVAKMTGEGCANMELDLNPTANLNRSAGRATQVQ